jgi:hypothetical protein
MKPNPSLPAESPDTFISRSSLAARWGCSYITIKRREVAGILKPIRFGPQSVKQSVRYRMSDVLAIEAAAGATVLLES